MEIGVIFPQIEIGSDPVALRDYAQAAEELGYAHLFIADHVLGADPAHHAHVVNSNYIHRSTVNEPFTLMGYLAGLTRKIQLSTGILILPQRQTALVAKQAAAVDVLSGGRLRLGIGVGWNHVEFEALGENFHNRGRRTDEQVEVLRALWTQEVVDFHGRWHNITHAGINPLPVQRPIPIWMGCGSSASPIPHEVVLRRVARLADGWCPSFSPGPDARTTIDRVHQYAREAGRDPSSLKMEVRLRLANKNPEQWLEEIKAWEAIGADRLSVEARQAGRTGPQAHINAIQQFKEVIQ